MDTMLSERAQLFLGSGGSPYPFSINTHATLGLGICWSLGIVGKCWELIPTVLYPLAPLLI